MNTALTLRSLIALTLCASLASCTKDEPLQPNRPAAPTPTSVVNDVEGLDGELTTAGNGQTSTTVDITSDTPAGTSTGLPNVVQQQGSELIPVQAGGGGPDTDTPQEDPVRLQGLQNMIAE